MNKQSLTFNPECLSEIVSLEETGETGLLKSLIDDYLANCPVLLKELEAAVVSKDYSSLERTAHTLKSSSRLLGLEKSADAALEIEDEASHTKFSEEKLVILKNCLIYGHADLKSYFAALGKK